MDVKIKATLSFTVSGSALEDGLAEYDELAVDGLLREVIDKAINSLISRIFENFVVELLKTGAVIEMTKMREFVAQSIHKT